MGFIDEYVLPKPPYNLKTINVQKRPKNFPKNLPNTSQKDQKNIPQISEIMKFVPIFSGTRKFFLHVLIWMKDLAVFTASLDSPHKIV